MNKRMEVKTGLYMEGRRKRGKEEMRKKGRRIY